MGGRLRRAGFGVGARAGGIRPEWAGGCRRDPTVVDPEGLEPPTPWFEAKCSIQLSYGSSFAQSEGGALSRSRGGSSTDLHRRGGNERTAGSEERPGGDLAVGELDAADAEGERFAAVEREIGGAGEFEAAAQFGKMVAGQLDAHGLADGDLPEGGDVGVEI